MDEFRIFLAELGENSRFAAAGIAVEEKKLMLGVCLTQFPFRANMVVKIHVWRLEEGVFHSIDSDDIPGGGEECVVQNKAVFQGLVKRVCNCIVHIILYVHRQISFHYGIDVAGNRIYIQSLTEQEAKHFLKVGGAGVL